MVERDFSYSVVGISLFLHRVGKKKYFSLCPGRGKLRGVGGYSLCCWQKHPLKCSRISVLSGSWRKSPNTLDPDPLMDA